MYVRLAFYLIGNEKINMRIDFIEAETKSNKIKITLIVISSILFIIVFSCIGIYFAKEYNTKIKKEKREKIINYISQLENEKQTQEENEKIEQENKTKLPIYSEEANNKIKNIYENKEKVAYLTFDDGPSRAVTPLILDLLKEENIKATFFVLGSNVEKNPDLLKREYEEGHYIANHGYSHTYSKIYSKPSSVLSEYEKTEKSIKKALENEDYNSHLFRFPGGYHGGKYASIKKEAAELLKQNDIAYIDWNCLSKDAEGANTKEKILENIKKYSEDKGTLVILMHDASTKILTYETLKDVIDYLRGEGYTFNNFYNIMSN